MQINRLRLVNFRQHERTELELGAGLTGIVGPNGAGKTTLLEAIAWAMYGMPAVRGSRETIRRRNAPPRAKVEVELEFTLGAHHYLVVRSLNNAELYQDGDPAPIANSIGAVSEKISRLLGMSRDEFFNTYFTGQKELAVMAAMSPTDRAQFLSRVLGYERIKIAQDRLRERRSVLRARLDAIRTTLPDPAELDAEEARARERLAATRQAERAGIETSQQAEQRLAEVRPRIEELQRARDAARGLESEGRVAEARLQAAEAKLCTLERQASEAAVACDRLREVLERLAPLPALRDERRELDREAEAFAARKGFVAQLDDVRSRLRVVENQIAQLPSQEIIERARERIRQVYAELIAVTVEAEQRRTAYVQDAQDAKTKRQGLLDQHQELKEQRQRILQAGDEGACPTCARPLGGEFDKVLGLLSRQLDQVLFNGNYYKQRIDQLREEPPELQAADGRRLELERALKDASADEGRLQAQAAQTATLRDERTRLLARVGELDQALGPALGAFDQARHDEVRRLMETLEPLTLVAERLRVLADNAEPLATEVVAVRAERDRADELRRGLADRLAALAYSEAAFVKVRDAVQAVERQQREAELGLVRVRAAAGAAEEAQQAVARRRAERAVREQEARAAAAELTLHQELDRALGDLRTDLNAALRPDLSELASGFLRDLTNGRYTDLELDESYAATLVDDGDPKAVISGGEEDVANLALRLAISQMIAERAGQPLSLLILDEIFGSLDEERRTAVVELLRSLADRFPQVILITHIDSVREGFDRVIRVGLDLSRGVAVVQDEPTGGHVAAA